MGFSNYIYRGIANRTFYENFKRTIAKQETRYYRIGKLKGTHWLVLMKKYIILDIDLWHSEDKNHDIVKSKPISETRNTTKTKANKNYCYKEIKNVNNINEHNTR